ncbi:hypothetical protein C5167_027325 [Papaver somniferum]|nr:hypothetical protein C5167_027325 [Papaver somniferum]
MSEMEGIFVTAVRLRLLREAVHGRRSKDNC